MTVGTDVSLIEHRIRRTNFRRQHRDENQGEAGVGASV